MAKRRAKKQVCSSNSSSNWAGLPYELLDLILEKLEKSVSLSEIIRLSSVCKSWNPKALRIKEKRMRSLNHQPPWLLINGRDRDPDKWSHRKQNLYSFTDGSQILRFELKIPYKYKHKQCFGSSHGWLFYKDTYKSSIIVLVDPLSKTVIHLPPISISGNFRKSFENIEYFALSNDPYLGSFEVLATLPEEGIVAHLKFGDQFWTYSGKLNLASCNYAFYKNCIFAVSNGGKIWSLDIIHSSNESSSRIIKVNEIAPHLHDVLQMSSPILSTFVETTNDDDDDLLVVYAYNKFFYSWPTYSVFKIVYSNGKFDRMPVSNLDGHCLFLNKNPYHSYQCISVLASNLDGCRANSIYHPYGFRKVRIEKERFLKCNIQEFNLEDQSVQMKEQRFPISQIRSIDSWLWLVPSVKHL